MLDTVLSIILGNILGILLGLICLEVRYFIKTFRK